MVRSPDGPGRPERMAPAWGTTRRLEPPRRRHRAPARPGAARGPAGRPRPRRLAMSAPPVRPAESPRLGGWASAAGREGRAVARSVVRRAEPGWVPAGGAGPRRPVRCQPAAARLGGADTIARPVRSGGRMSSRLRLGGGERTRCPPGETAPPRWCRRIARRGPGGTGSAGREEARSVGRPGAAPCSGWAGAVGGPAPAVLARRPGRRCGASTRCPAAAAAHRRPAPAPPPRGSHRSRRRPGRDADVVHRVTSLSSTQRSEPGR